MKKKFYNLMVICERAVPEFTVDEQTLASFEKSFDSGEGIIEFIDKEDDGEVRLRNKKLAGYKKTQTDPVPSELKNK